MADIMRCVDVRSLWNAKLILSVLEGGMLAQIVRALRAYGSVYTKSSEMAFSSGLKKTLWSGESEYLRFAYCERLTHVPLNPGGAPASLVFLCLQTYGKEDNALATLPILVSYVKLKSVRAVTLSMAIRFASRNTVLVALAVSTVMTVGVTICNEETARKKKSTTVILNQTLKPSRRPFQRDISEVPKPRHAAKLS